MSKIILFLSSSFTAFLPNSDKPLEFSTPTPSPNSFVPFHVSVIILTPISAYFLIFSNLPPSAAPLSIVKITPVFLTFSKSALVLHWIISVFFTCSCSFDTQPLNSFSAFSPLYSSGIHTAIHCIYFSIYPDLFKDI